MERESCKTIKIITSKYSIIDDNKLEKDICFVSAKIKRVKERERVREREL